MVNSYFRPELQNETCLKKIKKQSKQKHLSQKSSLKPCKYYSSEKQNLRRVNLLCQFPHFQTCPSFLLCIVAKHVAKSKQFRVTTIIPSCLKYLSQETWLMVSLGDTRFSGATELGSAPADCILIYFLHYQQLFKSELASVCPYLEVLVLFHISRIL